VRDLNERIARIEKETRRGERMEIPQAADMRYLLTEIERLEQNLRESRQDANKFSYRVGALEAENARLTAEIGRLNEPSETFCRACKTVESAGGDDNVRLCTAHARLAAELKTLQDTPMAKPLFDLTKCQDEVARLKAEIAELRRGNENLAGHLARANTKESILTTRVTELERVNDRCRGDLTKRLDMDVQEWLDGLSEELLNKKDGKLYDMLVAIAALKSKLETLQADYDKGLPSIIRSAGIEVANETIDGLIKENEDLKSQLEAAEKLLNLAEYHLGRIADRPMRDDGLVLIQIAREYFREKEKA
jgi:chromosome segregation ATPase